MFNGDAVVLLTEQLPNDIRALRDTIAEAEARRPGHVWERHRDVFDDIQDLKRQCGESGHSLLIALSGKPGNSLILNRYGRDERRTCVMCGTEEVGKLATGFLRRFFTGRTKWHFETLTGHITRR